MRAPIDYPQRQHLLKAAAAAGIDVTQLRKLLWYINAWPTLEHFGQVVRNLHRVLGATDQAWPRMLAKLHIDFLVPLLSSLISVADSIQFPPTPVDETGEPQWLPDKTGWLSRNPFYFALCALAPDNSPQSEACCLLTAHVFLAHLVILCRPTGRVAPGTQVNGDSSMEAYEAYGDAQPWPALRVPCRHAGIALRGLCSGEDWANALMKTFPLNQRPKMFALTNNTSVDASVLTCGKSERWLEDRIDYICNYVRQAHGLKLRRPGHGSNGRAKDSTNLDKKLLLTDESPTSIGTLLAGSADPSQLVSSDGQSPEDMEDWDRYDECPHKDIEPQGEEDGEQNGEDEEQGEQGKDQGRKGDTAASNRNQAGE